MNRRIFLKSVMTAATFLGLSPWSAKAEILIGDKKFILSDKEWKDKLPPAQYGVLRKEDTEMAFTSPLNGEKRKGTFACAGCALPLFSSQTKFDSGTGWPSFFDHLPNSI